MRAPSFRCTENNGSLILHYYSERPGLEHIVIGIVKAVASKLHGVDVEIKILKRKGDIIENGENTSPASIVNKLDVENRSESGNYNNQQQSNDECQCINNNILSSDLNSKCQGVYSF